MPNAVALALTLPALALALVVAARSAGGLSEALAAGAGALLLLATGVIGVHGAGRALERLGPTVGFLAALLVLADGCRREGLFELIGEVMARSSRGHGVRLLALVFLFASAVTAVLSLDATIVLLTPVVLASLAGARRQREPHLYACAHLANSASLLLPVSNLTNLLAFRDSGLSFTRFSAVMAAPWLAAIAIEWLVLRVGYRRVLAEPLRETAARQGGAASPEPPAQAGGPAAGGPAAGELPAQQESPGRSPRRALVIVMLTLVGFAVTQPLGVAPAWIAAIGAAALLAAPAARGQLGVQEVVRAADPPFLVFVLALGVIVQGATIHGLGDAARSLLPLGVSLGDLILIAAVAALAANLLNNLPAVLLLSPLAAAGGPAAILAVLMGVNIGPNLTPAGSLATLLWRRVLRDRGAGLPLRGFLRLGLISVPAALVGSTVCLWAAGRLLLPQPGRPAHRPALASEQPGQRLGHAHRLVGALPLERGLGGHLHAT